MTTESVLSSDEKEMYLMLCGWYKSKRLRGGWGSPTGMRILSIDDAMTIAVGKFPMNLSNENDF
jgi:hypothetical protein